MDFFRINERSIRKDKKDIIELYPDFLVKHSEDLIVKGRSFCGVWDEERGMWSTKEYDVAKIVDRALWRRADELRKDPEVNVSVKTMVSFTSQSWMNFKTFLTKIPDSPYELDTNLTFANTVVTREDRVSKRLPYPLEEGSYSAYDEMIGTLYDPEERAKIEWAIGSIVAGEGKDIQKFLVFYGEAGSGKSTILNIIEKLFEGYCTMFDAKAITSSSNSFSTEVFRGNPLVAIQHDGDLSRIEDNSKFNSIVSHENMSVNEKFKSSYTTKMNCFLFMATNKPVKITDAKSGIIRRLIDVNPSGRKIHRSRYRDLVAQINFELGAIAYHCLQVYKEMGCDYYSGYRPMDMIYRTDVFFNFVESYYDVFDKEDGITLVRAYDMYKAYCDDALVEFKLAKYKFRDELKNYFSEFHTRIRIDGPQYVNYYNGFLRDKFNIEEDVSDQPKPELKPELSISLECTKSILDEAFSDAPAQYADDKEKPLMKWVNVTTKLSDIDTSKLHYVRLPGDHIFIDFDLKDAEGNKSLELNLEAASKWPATYAELSKGGSGIHLHYIYDGDTSRLSTIFGDGIEVKTFVGGSSLRRRLTKCNDVPIATINSGLPLKGEKMINSEAVKSERALRDLISRNLKKKIHPGTKPSVDFIFKILEDAYTSGLKYDVTDLRSRILLFATNSTNQANTCIKLVNQMKFKSDEPSESPDILENEIMTVGTDELVFFDVEVFPNLFLVNWKMAGPDASCVSMINPTPEEVSELFKFKLVGFNCRRYDNHILYGRYLGYNNEQLYNLSTKIVNKKRDAMFGEAYNISYTDVYDFSSKKQSLKKFEIDLGIHHQELGLPWDKPVPPEKWEMVAAYCNNDVIATEATFYARKADWTARQILANVAGMTVNDTTNSLTTRIIFGREKNPQTQFNYRFMGDGQPDQVLEESEDSVFSNGSPIFPGYTYEYGKSIYKGEEVGEGGYVYAEPGMHYNVAILDVASMHPSSIVAENLFGPVYTKRFKDILDARIAIKHENFDLAKKMLDGKLAPYLDDPSVASDLAFALKIAINSVYGLTAAKFSNPFRDPRNKDNIVAKRGALFMINLKYEVQRRGFTVAHIKTDSIKIPNATPDIIDFAYRYGRAYGYTFEHEATYDRMCLVNDAVYIAKYDKEGERGKSGKSAGKWSATGAQFAHPYVFKKLFSKEDVIFDDLCETKSVTSSMYLDMNEKLPDVSGYEKEYEKTLDVSQSNSDAMARIEDLKSMIAKGHDYQFIGKSGLFCPVKPGSGGGLLMRETDGKFYSITGTKGYRWLEAETIKTLGKEDAIDYQYFTSLVDAAISNISKYGDFEMFVTTDLPPVEDTPPWALPCGKKSFEQDCVSCDKFLGKECSFEKLPF